MSEYVHVCMLGIVHVQLCSVHVGTCIHNHSAQSLLNELEPVLTMCRCTVYVFVNINFVHICTYMCT